MIDDPLNGLIILISGHGKVVPASTLIDMVMVANRENKKVEMSAFFIT